MAAGCGAWARLCSLLALAALAGLGAEAKVSGAGRERVAVVPSVPLPGTSQGERGPRRCCSGSCGLTGCRGSPGVGGQACGLGGWGSGLLQPWRLWLTGGAASPDSKSLSCCQSTRASNFFLFSAKQRFGFPVARPEVPWCSA